MIYIFGAILKLYYGGYMGRRSFSRNRVAEILKHTIPQQWRHVKTKENPADAVSRDLHPAEMADCSLWFYGPKFLYYAENCLNAEFKKSPQFKNELKAEDSGHIVAAATVISPSCGILDLIDSRNSFRHLQRVLGYVLRFINSLKTPKTKYSNK